MDQTLLEALMQTTPTIEYCEYFNGLSPLWNYSRHKHPYNEIIYRVNGCGRTDLVDQTQNFVFFDTLLYPVDCWHEDKFEASAENECYCIWFSLPDVVLPEALQVQDCDGKLGFLFRMIYDEWKSPAPSQIRLALFTKALLVQALHFSEQQQLRGRHGSDAVNTVIQYLNIHYSQKIVLEELAELVHTSQTYLSKLFKRETGQTVIDYLNGLRIQEAKRLLITTSKSVDEVAQDVGFSSPKYFTRIFRAYTETTPSAFRNRAKAGSSR